MTEHIYLAHHGIKGMKWGVRRFRNPDGTLTEAGKKRYSNTRTLYKDLKKQIHSARGKANGGSNRWMVVTPIGENSKSYIENAKTKSREYHASDKYKAWIKKVDAYERSAGRKFESGQISIEEYDSGLNALMKQRPRKNYHDPYDGGYEITMNGRKYARSYLNGAGKELSIAYLMDLGYSQETSEKLVEQLLRSNMTLGMD